MNENKKLEVLYVGSLCSERLIKYMLEENLGLPNLAAQKYHRLLAEGMALNQDIFTVKVVGVPEYYKSIKNEVIVYTPAEISNGVFYNYTPIVLLPGFKNVSIVINLLYKIAKWKFSKTKNKKLLVIDILNFKISITSVIASLLFRLNTIAIVTDLPEMMYVLQEKISFLNKLTYKVQNFLLQHVYGYVFLTYKMNNLINIRKKPYCIIEGLAEYKLSSYNTLNHFVETHQIRIFHYSGGLYEKFGVKMLIEAFMLLSDTNIRLHLFGNGDLVDYIKSCQIADTRIEFFGYMDNRIVLAAQQKSFVLVNPRFSDGQYNQYSFPSKTIEYMSSGVPLLTTKLKGIPDEYSEFVYFFEEETVEGYKNTMNKMLTKSSLELATLGHKAKSFILSRKNNIEQSKLFYQAFVDCL